MPGSSTSARITLGWKFRKLRERFFAAAHAQHFAIPLAEQRFVSLARVFLVFDDQDALLRCFLGWHLELNLPAVSGKSK